MKKWIIYLLCVFATVLISSCTTLDTTQPTPLHRMTWQQRHTQLSQIGSWDMTAALGIQQPHHNSTASACWKQRNDRYSIVISAPLNISSIRIVGRPGKVTLWKSSTKSYIAKSADQLLYQQLNWWLPVENMKYWVKGLPAPKLAHQTIYDGYRHIKFLQQQGWKIHYQQYRSVNDIDLPSIITFTHNELKIKLVIRRWRLY